ncbi:MAG: lytic transglycosylase domain-containing protein [Tissierellaceae bacterium]
MFRLIKLIKKTIIVLIVFILLLSVGLFYISTSYPLIYEDSIARYSTEFGVDFHLVASIINVESKYDRNAISRKNARGLMQIGQQTGQWASEVLEIEDYDEESLFEPDTNIRIGAWYINILMAEFDDNLDLVLASYNAGSGNVSKWLCQSEYSRDGKSLDNIPFKETEDYLRKVKSNYRVYSRIYRSMKNGRNLDSFYINFLHNIRRTIKSLIGLS